MQRIIVHKYLKIEAELRQKTVLLEMETLFFINTLKQKERVDKENDTYEGCDGI